MLMKWIVDRIEGNIAVIENIVTKEIREVSLNTLPSPIHEGSMLCEKDSQYILDNLGESNRREEILKIFNSLKKG